MSARAAGPGPEVADCADCQRLVADTPRELYLDIDAHQLCDQLRAGSWRITDDACWRTLSALLRQAGFAPGLDWAGQCPVVPSNATIAAVGALDAALKGWIDLGSDAPLGRLLVALQFVAWLGSNRTNRRVLLHHGTAALASRILAAVRSTQADLFGYAAGAARESQADSLLAADARCCEWWRGAASADGAVSAAWLGHSVPVEPGHSMPGTIAASAAYALFQHTMFLCGWLFDPGQAFAAFLMSGSVPEPATDPGDSSTQGDASRVLSESLLLWQQLETAPPRTHFSPAVAGLCSVVGGVVLSGALAGDEVNDARVAERIAQAMRMLNADEAYLAWRLLVLIWVRRPELLARSPAALGAVDALWSATAACPTEYLRGYLSFGILGDLADRPLAEPGPAGDSLGSLLAVREGWSIDDCYDTLVRNVRLCDASTDNAVEPATLASFLEPATDPFSGTRLRRATDAVLADIAQHASVGTLTSAAAASIQSVHRMFLSTTLGDSRFAGCASDANNDLVGLEYASFLLRLWRLPLRRRLQSAVFHTIGVDVWDRLLRNQLTPADTTPAARGGPCHTRQTAAHILAMSGWLVAHSAPANAASGSGDSGNPILTPAVCKLVFSRLAEAVAGAATQRGTGSTGQTDPSAQWALSRGAAQGLAVVCWRDVQWFRQLLHETQAVCDLLSATIQMQRELDCAGAAGKWGLAAQSIGDLSVVSLPDESVYDISDGQSHDTGARLGVQLLSTAMFLLHMSIAGTAGISGTGLSDSMTPWVVMQLCHARIRSREEPAETVGSMDVLRDMLTSSVRSVASLSAVVVTRVLRWLFVCALCRDVDTGGICADAHDRTVLLQEWSVFVAQRLAQVDLAAEPALQQHARLVGCYRSCLAEAALAIGTHRASTDINAAAIRDGALECALALVQMMATLGSGTESADGPSSSDAGASLSALACEVLKLVSFLVHGAADHMAALANVGGYQAIHACITTVAQRVAPASARTPIAEGVLALLSGAMEPFGCRSWRGLQPDRRCIPALAGLYAELPLSACISVLRFLSYWCEDNSRVRWWLSQSTIARQAIERLQVLFADLASTSTQAAARRDCASAYVKYLRQMLTSVMSTSTCGADVKLAMRTLVSGPAEPCPAGPALDVAEIVDYTLLVRRMLVAIIARCARAERGLCYFDFDGRPAALHLPSTRRISEHGFTFAVWIRPGTESRRDKSPHLLAVESLGSLSLTPDASTPGAPGSAVALPLLLRPEEEPRAPGGTVLRLAMAGTDGVLVWYNRAAQSVDIEITAAGGRHRASCGNGGVGPGRWHSLAVCYAPTKRSWSPFGSSNVHVYIDGVQAHKGSHPYIDHATDLVCYIGGSPGAGERGMGSAFSGRIAGIRMFDGVLRTSEIELLHHLGPAHTTQLRRQQEQDAAVRTSTLAQVSEAATAVSLSTSLPRDLARLFQSSDLGNRLILCPDAKTARDAWCLDLSPIGVCQTIARENARQPQSSHGASAETPDRGRTEDAAQPWLLCGEVQAVTATTIHQVMHCLGGVESVLVLLYHLDWAGSTTPPTAEGPLGSEENTFDQRVLQQAPLPSFFYLLRDLLRGSPGDLARVSALNLVPLVARILQQRRDIAQHLTMATLRAMQAFQVALDTQGGTLPSAWSDTSWLWSQVQRDLILNFRIWRRAGVDVQLQHLHEAKRLLCRGRVGDEQGRRSNASAGIGGGGGRDADDVCLGIRWILYSLFDYYPYDTSQHVSQQHLQRARQRAQSLSARSSTPTRSSPADDGAARPSTESPSSGAAAGTAATGATYELDEVDGEDTVADMPGFPSLQRSETRQLRRVLLRTLELFLTASEEQHSSNGGAGGQVPRATRADVGHLVRHLLYACNRDTEHTREVLQLLFRCLADGSPNATGLAAMVLAARGMDVLTHIIECDDGAMAAEALNIVVLLLVLTAATREHASAASRITSSLRGRAVVAVDGEQVSRALALVRTKRALTPALYRALLLLALGDHAALLAGINIDAAPGDASEGPAARYTRHARAPSTPQSSSSSVYLVDDVGADVHESFVAPLPARLVRDPEAWAAALELACAPATGPAMRVAVVRDLRCLLEDEPANYDRVGSSRVLEQLVTIVVLGGYLADDDGRDGDEGDPLDAPTPRLPSAYAKAMGHLELVPHTTLDRRMQTLAVGHIRARRAWVHRRVGQLRSLPLSGGSAASAPASGCGDAALLVRAQAELMARLSEWSQAAIHLVELFAEHCFASTPDHASRVHRSIVALWALTPTGSLPLAVRLLSRILSRVQFRLREEQQQQVQQQEQQQVQQQQPEGAAQARRHTARRSAQAGESLLADNLCRFAGFVLDMLLNYRQFQEYVAYHHDDLRALSESASLAAAAGPARTERDAAYNGQHSPWDDMPALVRELADLMLELGASDARSQSRLCSQTLRLVVSGVRSMRLEQVAESLRYLVLLLERHPGLAGSGGPLHSACDDGCILGQKVLAVLGYVHEAYMFSEEQMEPGDSIGRQYMAVFQCCRGCLGECLGGVCRDQLAALGPEAESLDWDRFARFVKSTEWQEVYHARLMPAMRRTEEEEMQLAGQSLVAFVTTLRELLVGSQRAEAALVRQAKDAQTAVASSTLPIEADEVSSVKADEQRRPYAQWGPVWRQRLQALSAPRGAWRPGHGAARSADADSQQWVLDATENRWRMRRRLAKGAPNEDLRIAADRRDRTGKRRESSAQHQHQVGGRGNSSSDDACDITHLSLSVSGADPADARRLDGEDDWSLVTPEDLGLIAAAAADPATAHLRVAAERIALLGGVYGHVELTQTALRFVVERDGRGSPCMRGLDSTANNPGLAHGMPRAVHAELSRDLAWPLAEIQQVHFRRYMMQRSAVEVFFEDRSSVLLNVPSKKALMQLVWKLTSLPAVNHGLALADIRSPPALLRRLGLTERWQRGELSNFGYLMALNTVAGRSYNDLSQYPVFPWVIRDYTSKWLDLQAPRTYRDLSRPIGAMNEKRLRHFIERYESFEDPAGRIKKFLYGTHYSSAASVAHYMIRLEPFASVHISLQSGKFDHADRQFHSLGDTWNSCMTGSGDVKELIPEFFYLPEFLVNHSGLNLGVKQNGTALGDVCLPPWASTPDEFVRINRQALESEHVSARLHQWIDLIFGFKQRGPEAVKAHNVFYYLTYEDAVDIDAIQDPVERASIESQIHYFGQTPAQLFTAPHPPRRGNVPRPRYAPLVTPTGRVQQFVLQVSGADISFVGSGWGAGAAGQRRPTTLPPAVPWPTTQQCLTSDVAPDRPLVQDVVTAVDAVGRIYMYTIGLSACDGDKLQLAVDPLAEGYYALAAACPPSRSQQLAGATRRPVAYAVVPDAPELVISCAHLDGSIRCTRIAGSGGLAADASLQGGVPSALGRGTGMTNAYASAVVGAMAGTGVDSPGRATTKPGGTEVSSLRSIAGLFGGAPAGSKHQPGADAEGAAAATSSPPPSTFIPLAARLLDAVDESCCAYLADQQSCIAVSGDGTRVAAGSAQGMVSILALEHATEPGVAGGVAAAAAATVNIASALPGIGVPLLFAAGLADPMNTSLGHTSMAAYSAGSPRGVARRWTLRHVMHGHDAAVLDVAIDTDHDLVASASSDGTVILWAERTGQYLRTVVPIDEGASGCRDATPPLPRHHRRYSRVERVFVGAEATLVCYTVSGATGAAENSDQLDPARPLNQCAIPMPPNPTASCRSEVAALHVFSINGRHLRTRKLVHHLRDVALTRDGRYGACVSSDSRVAIFDTHTLGIVRQFELPGCGRSVVWSGASEQQLVVGCEGGRMVIVSAGASDI